MSLKQTLKKAKQIERQLERQNVTGVQHSLGTVKARNYLALDPLLKKGGIHEKEDIDIVRKKRRRETKQQLRQTDWLLE
ncbi:hypothetical protein [Psychrobacter maritimus]|jgi:hypothetical protein|uniref:hypothetical protein n=1 Tax=Psychrobacter maritimus TaxID=256325 RepID=UPI00191ABD64|nr:MULTISPECIES: hypothetical protein [Psychrobacter]WGV13341.1 hypothetical protein QJS82_01245 [Psychrobacter sp. WB2]